MINGTQAAAALGALALAEAFETLRAAHAACALLDRAPPPRERKPFLPRVHEARPHAEAAGLRRGGTPAPRGERDPRVARPVRARAGSLLAPLLPRSWGRRFRRSATRATCW